MVEIDLAHEGFEHDPHRARKMDPLPSQNHQDPSLLSFYFLIPTHTRRHSRHFSSEFSFYVSRVPVIQNDFSVFFFAFASLRSVHLYGWVYTEASPVKYLYNGSALPGNRSYDLLLKSPVLYPLHRCLHQQKRLSAWCLQMKSEEESTHKTNN